MSIVKSFSVGNGDMFYISHDSDSFTIIDCCLEDYSTARILKELKAQSATKGIVRFISTHPDDDHIRGLTDLHEQMQLVNFYCVRNQATKDDITEDFEQYCALRDDPKKTFFVQAGCKRKWLNEPSEERGGAGVQVLWPNTSNMHYRVALTAAAEGESANNISTILQYRLKSGATILWMGDLETDFMEKLDPIPVGPADIVFAPHHGRDSGELPTEWLETINPQLIVIGEAPSENLNYYADYNTITQNSAGDIVFRCEAGKTHVYVSERNYYANFLHDEGVANGDGFYVGTLML